jgi:hypothetical protein
MVLFSIEDPEHDMSNYFGRFLSFRKICNPFIAFYSNSTIIEMQKLLEDQRVKEESAFKTKGDRKISVSQ